MEKYFPSVSQYNTIQYNTIQYNTTQHNTTQYNTIQYNTIQYNTIQYNWIELKNTYINAVFNIGILATRNNLSMLKMPRGSTYIGLGQFLSP